MCTVLTANSCTYRHMYIHAVHTVHTVHVYILYIRYIRYTCTYILYSYCIRYSRAQKKVATTTKCVYLDCIQCAHYMYSFGLLNVYPHFVCRIRSIVDIPICVIAVYTVQCTTPTLYVHLKVAMWSTCRRCTWLAVASAKMCPSSTSQQELRFDASG